MSEGGYFPWKRQTITGGKPGDYSSLSKPLPALPKGMAWLRNPETREWSIIDINKTNNDSGDDLENNRSDKSLLLSVGIPVNIDLSTPTKRLPANCDYLVHVVQSTDTFQGICLKYGITPLALRQVNKFSGSNLILAPKALVIPLSRKDYQAKLLQQNEDNGSNELESKINHFLLSFHRKQASTALVGRKEAIAYLDMNDWNLEMAIKDAKEDFGWELGEGEKSPILL